MKDSKEEQNDAFPKGVKFTIEISKKAAAEAGREEEKEIMYS